MQIVNRAVLAIAMGVALSASAQSYPNKPVRVLVPFPPGGATDIVTRIVSQKLNEIWGQSVVIDNRGGAGGNIAGELAAKSAPDGYTLFMTSGSIVTANQYIYRKMPFSPEKDFVAVSGVAAGPQIVAVNPGFAAKSIRELIALAKAKPKSITFGSAGVATQTHLAGENFFYAAGIDVVHIPYKGEGPALSELIGGQIQLVMPNLAAAIGFVTQGKLRALAVTSRERIAQLPDVPAVAETLPGFENVGWFGWMFPAGTPKSLVDKVHQDTVKALQSPDIRGRFEQLGMAPLLSSPAELAKKIKDESAHWAKIVRERKLEVE